LVSFVGSIVKRCAQGKCALSIARPLGAHSHAAGSHGGFKAPLTRLACDSGRGASTVREVVFFEARESRSEADRLRAAGHRKARCRGELAYRKGRRKWLARSPAVVQSGRPDPPARVQLRKLHNVILQHNLAFSTRIVQRNPHAFNAHSKSVLEYSPGSISNERLEHNCERRDSR